MADQAGQGRLAQLSSRCRRRESPVSPQPVSDAATGNWICFSHDSTTNRRGKSDHPRPSFEADSATARFSLPKRLREFLHTISGRRWSRTASSGAWICVCGLTTIGTETVRRTLLELNKPLPNDPYPSSEASMHARGRPHMAVLRRPRPPEIWRLIPSPSISIPARACMTGAAPSRENNAILGNHRRAADNRVLEAFLRCTLLSYSPARSPSTLWPCARGP